MTSAVASVTSAEVAAEEAMMFTCGIGGRLCAACVRAPAARVPVALIQRVFHQQVRGREGGREGGECC